MFKAHTEVLPYWRQALQSEPRLEQVYVSVMDYLSTMDLHDEAIVGDFLVALAAGRTVPAVSRRSTHYYGLMLHLLVNGQRWRHLTARLALLKRLSDAGRTARTNPQGKSPWQAAIEYVCQHLLNDLVSQKPRDPAFKDGLPWCDFIGWANNDRYKNARVERKDTSAWLVEDHLLAVTEVASRAVVPGQVENLVNLPLVSLCAKAELIENRFVPRQLEVIRRDGDDRDRAPGDHSSVRAVAKKLREDQIPKILFSEFAPLLLKDRETGQKLVLDKIVNRSPLIYEHFQPEFPQIRHRICLPILIGAATAPWNRSQDESRAPFNLARRLGYELLLNASLKIPHEQIQADIVWLEKRGPEWWGAQFPISTFKVESRAKERYRNTLLANQILPFLFARDPYSVRPSQQYEVRVLHEGPNVILPRLIGQHVYRGIFPAVIMESDGERPECLPQASMALPPDRRGLSNVLSAFCVWGETQSHYEADLFSDLMSAWVAPLPLMRRSRHSIVVDYLEMIIGPMQTGQPAIPML